MSKPELIKRSGWAFMASAFAFITIMGNSDAVQIVGSEISAILLAVGLLGLRARYGEYVGGFGRNILLLGASGPIFLIIVIAMGLSGILTETQIDEGLWVLLFLGPAFALLALTLFGMAALRSKSMSRLNWLPVFAGIWYPVWYFFLAGYLFTHNGVYPGQYQMAFNILHLLQFFTLCLFGAVLLTDTSEKIAMA